MSTFLISILKLCDVYATPFNFNVNGNKMHKTTIGGFFSILTILIFIAFTVIFAEDLVSHSNPKLVSYVKHIDKPQMPYIHNKNFTMPIQLIYRKNQINKITNQSEYHVDIFNSQLFKVVGKIQTRGIQSRTTTNDEKEILFSKCKEHHLLNFTDLNITNRELIKSDYFCLDLLESLDIYGSSFSSIDLKNIRLFFKINMNLLNSYYGLNKTNTGPQLNKTEIDYLANIVMHPSVGIFPITFRGFVQSYKYDADNYENPIQKIMGMSEFPVTLLDQTRLIGTFKLGESFSDNNILFKKSNSNEEKHFRLYDVKTITLSRDQIKEDGYLNYFQVIIFIDDGIVVYQRSYIKIQEVLANSVSFGRVLMIVLSLVNYFYNKDRINESLAYQFFRRNPETSYSTDLVYQTNDLNKQISNNFPNKKQRKNADTVLNMFSTLPKYFLSSNTNNSQVISKQSKYMFKSKSLDKNYNHRNDKEINDYDNIKYNTNFNNNTYKNLTNKTSTPTSNYLTSPYNGKSNLNFGVSNRSNKSNIKLQQIDEVSHNKKTINSKEIEEFDYQVGYSKPQTKVIQSSLKLNKQAVFNFAKSYKNRTSFEFNYDKAENLHDSPNSELKNFMKDKLSFCEKLQGWVFKAKKLDKNLQHKLQFFKKSRLKIEKRLDIIYILTKLDELECMKMLFLNPFQTLSLQYLKKPNISFINMNNPRDLYEKFTSEIDDEKNKNNLIAYYKEKLEDHSVEQMDLKILEMIEPELKKTILLSIRKNE